MDFSDFTTNLPSFGLPTLGHNKLRIWAYSNPDLSGLPIGHFEAMYNPERIGVDYSSSYAFPQYIGRATQAPEYTGERAGNLRIALDLDSSLFGNSRPVDVMVKELRELLHQPIRRLGSRGGYDLPYLKITWGGFNWHENNYFEGRALSTDVEYSAFGRNGIPSRARVTLTLLPSRTVETRYPELMNPLALAAIKASDAFSLSMEVLSVSRDLLKIVGLAADYISMAYDNDLDNLDDYAPGDTLVAQTEAVGGSPGSV